MLLAYLKGCCRQFTDRYFSSRLFAFTKKAAFAAFGHHPYTLNCDLIKNFVLENVKSFQKFKIQSFSNGQNCSFWAFKMTKLDFTSNLSGRKILKFPHCVFPIRLPGL